MALILRNLKPVSRGSNGFSDGYEYYHPTDTIADITASGYFDAKDWGENDGIRIKVECADGPYEVQLVGGVASVVSQSYSKLANDSQGYDIIVLAGQSNPVGRYGPIDATLDATNPRIFQYGHSDGKIKLAQDPLDHWDETANTVGPGLSIAKEYLNTINSTRKVLLVPAADGGTGFSTGEWDNGGAQREYVKTAVNAIMASNPNSRVVAFCWHQGERDYLQTQGYYSDKIARLIQEYRTEITGASDAFFIAGEIPSWSTRYSANIRASLFNVTKYIDRTAFVETEDLTDGGDSLHFDAASARTLGVRYADKIAELKANPNIIRETGALGHWFLNRDNQGYFDAGSGRELTETNLTPTFDDRYAILGDGDFNGLESDIPDSDNQTICAVFRTSASTVDSFIIAGTLTSNSGDGGSAVFSNGTGNTRFLSRTAGATEIASSIQDNEWIFTAYSERGVRQGFVGDETGNLKVKSVSVKSLSSNNIAIGTSYYNVASFKNTFDVAEFIVFDRALSADEIAQVYERSVLRIGNIGLLVE